MAKSTFTATRAGTWAAAMRGGRIKVDGNAGDYAGSEMHGGLIHIAGNAGNQIGAAYPGSKKGMTDGTILIGGDAGSEVGASMRRGTLVVGGSCADAVGFNMIAGSILVFGSCGARPGAGMRRGTIGLFGAEPTRLLPTFRAAGRFRPLFLRLVFRELVKLGFPVDLGLLEAELLLSHGDLVALGKGEVWMKSELRETIMATEYIKIAGGTVYDPANGVDGQVRDIWISGGKIVAASDRPRSSAGARDRRRGAGRHARRRRHALSYRRAQGQQRAEDVPRTETARSARTPNEWHAQRHDGERAQHIRDRLPLCGPRLHDGVRRSHSPLVSPACSRGIRGHAVHRQGLLHAHG